MRTPVLVLAGIVCLAATFGWVHSARHRYRLVRRIDMEAAPDAYTLAWSTFRKEAHSASLYGLLALATFVTAFADAEVVFALVAVPAMVSMKLA